MGLATKFVLIALLSVFWEYLSVAQSLKDIQLADRERAGDVYLSEAWASFQAALAGREPPAKESEKVAVAGTRYDELMDAAAARKAFSAAAPGADRITAGQDFIQKIADGSWLTLDPDLDSYCVMDATTTKMPEVATAGAALIEAARQFAAGEKASASDEAGSAYAVGRLLRSARALDGSFQSSANGNPDGSVRSALGPLACWRFPVAPSC